MQVCKVCKSEQRQAVEAELRNKTPLSLLASRTGLSRSSIHRHSQHLDERALASSEAAKAAGGNEQLAEIDRRIAVLLGVQRRAKRKRDSELELKASRELRAWYALRSELAAKLAHVPAQPAAGETITVEQGVAWALELLQAAKPEALTAEFRGIESPARRAQLPQVNDKATTCDPVDASCSQSVTESRSNAT